MWLKLHDHARGNKVLGKNLRKLAAVLSITKAQALGHIAMLWLSAIRDGDLTDFSADEIASAAEWRGDPEQFLQSIVLCGLVDDTGARRTIADWNSIVGSAKEADRKAKQRARKRGHAPMSQDNSGVSLDLVRSQAASPAMSQDKARDTASSPGTDPLLSDEIDRRLDALVALPGNTH